MQDIITNHKSAIRESINRDWLHLYPTWVQDAFKKGLQTEVLPSYAVTVIANAIKVTKAINYKMEKQVNSVEQVTTVKSGHRKNVNKSERDKQIRMAMKGNSSGGSKKGRQQ